MNTRYTDSELEPLLHDAESDRTERKETFKGDVPEKARQGFVLLPMICQIIRPPEFCLSAQKIMELHLVAR